MASSRVQDAARMLAGIALVAREAALATNAIAHLRSGDLPSFAKSVVSRAVVSATDLAGLSRGTPKTPGVSEDIKNPSHNQVPHTDPLPSSTDLGRCQTIAQDGPSLSSHHMEPEPTSQVSIEEPSQLPSDIYEKTPASTHGDSGADMSPSHILQEDRVDIVGEKQELTNVLPTSVNAVPSSTRTRKPRERRVPASPFGRAFGFARLGAGLALGTLQESAKRLWEGQGNLEKGQFALSPFMTEQNAERLALGLCRMRGAALKLGQMLSIQDETLLPPQVLAALEMVRQGADVMPKGQLNRVITNELGPDWKSRLGSFEYEPIASASIGQVHKAVLKDGREVAMKIQYPGVARSIDSDIENVRRLLEFTNLIPKGLYLDQAMKYDATQNLSRLQNKNWQESAITL